MGVDADNTEYTRLLELDPISFGYVDNNIV